MRGEPFPRPPTLEIAIIAAAKDGKCPLPTTHLPGPTPDQHGETVHIFVHGRHTFPIYRRDVAELVLQFLAPAIECEWRLP